MAALLRCARKVLALVLALEQPEEGGDGEQHDRRQADDGPAAYLQRDEGGLVIWEHIDQPSLCERTREGGEQTSADTGGGGAGAVLRWLGFVCAYRQQGG